MSLSHDFHRVSNELPAGQAVSHSLVIHSDTIANSYGIDFKRHSTPTANPLLYRLGDCSQMDVAGDNLAKAIDYSDKWLIPVI
jgi:hypothetical protein